MINKQKPAPNRFASMPLPSYAVLSCLTEENNECAGIHWVAFCMQFLLSAALQLGAEEWGPGGLLFVVVVLFTGN